jgi:hypothetical protein
MKEMIFKVWCALPLVYSITHKLILSCQRNFLNAKFEGTFEVNIFMQLGFSSNSYLFVTSGGLCSNSLVAKRRSKPYSHRSSNFQLSNWQKAQLITDLFDQKQSYLQWKNVIY